MFCLKCGKEIEDNSTFCSYCGAQLKGSDQAKQEQHPQVIIAAQQGKSLGIALALTIVFGGFGLLYASVKGAMILLFIDLVAFVGCFSALGSMDFSGSQVCMMIIILSWPVSIIWSWYAVKKYNENLRNGKINSDAY